MKRALLMVGLVACAFALQACNSGEITAQQQKAKKDALQRVADEDKANFPNRENRGR